MSTLFAIIGILLCLLTLPGTLELLLLTLGGILPSKSKKAPKTGFKRLAVIIPAHNEELSIAKTLEHLTKCKGQFDIIVIADNCSDKTASISKSLQARVIERNSEKRGKNHALDFAFQILLKEGYDFFAVVDADTVVMPNFISEIQTAFSQGVDAVQVYYGVLNPDQALKARLMRVALMANNLLRPKGRQRWGFSAGIFGNGFALSRQTLLDVPFQVDSVVEDTAYHIRLVENQKKVHFIETTSVLADMPLLQPGAATQRIRWEGGRFSLMKKEIPRLTKKVLKGETRLLEPLFDLLLLPLAYQLMLLLILSVIPFLPTQIYAWISLGVICFHLIASLIIGKAGWKDVAVLLLLPFYLLWKLVMLFRIFLVSRKGFTWDRTPRSNEEKKE